MTIHTTPKRRTAATKAVKARATRPRKPAAPAKAAAKASKAPPPRAKTAIPELRPPQTEVSAIALDPTLGHTQEPAPDLSLVHPAPEVVEFEVVAAPPAKAARQGKTKKPARAPPVSTFKFNLHDLPPLLRLSDLCRDPRRNYPGLIPVSRSAWLNGVERGIYPPPIKVGAKVVAWRREDILEVIENGARGVQRTKTVAEVLGRPYRQPPAE